MPYAQIAEYNATTGEITYRDMTPEEEAERDAAAAAATAAETAQNQFKGQIAAIAQSTVGVALQDLTAAQIKSLMAILLFKAGGVNPANMQVRPLNTWV